VRVGVLMGYGEGDTEGKTLLSAFLQGLAKAGWSDRICAENINHYEGRNYYSDKNAKPPRADKPDF
jgi:hypothetical protein